MRELRSTLLSVHARLVVQVDTMDREKVRHSGGLFRQDTGNSTCHTCEGGHTALLALGIRRIDKILRDGPISSASTFS
jgi:hypothetical protein